ncbi:MAG TPA: hypothetical protein VGM93_08195, partial [Acidimicrobiales bacterium]
DGRPRGRRVAPGNRPTVAAAAIVTVLSLVLVGCVGPSRTETDYRRKAATTLDRVRSAVETTILGIEATERHHLPAAYVSVLLAEAEDDASAVDGTFRSIQPPDEHSDALHKQATDLVSDAVDDLAQARIVARRGDLAALSPLLKGLRATAARLQQMSDRVGA